MKDYVETLFIPKNKIRDTIRIIRKGLKGEKKSEVKEELEIWCEEMEQKIVNNE